MPLKTESPSRKKRKYFQWKDFLFRNESAFPLILGTYSVILRAISLILSAFHLIFRGFPLILRSFFLISNAFPLIFRGYL